MADAKISELPSATTPLAGTEVLPIVQGGETRKVPASALGGDPLALSDQSATPSAPTSGLKLYGVAKAGRRRPTWIGPAGVDTSVQSFLAANKVGFWSANGNGTNGMNNAAPDIILFNFGHTTSGTATARNVATTNLFTRTRRIGYAVGTGASAGTRHAKAQFSRDGGFEYIVRFGISALPLATFAGIYSVGLGSSTSFQRQIGSGAQSGVGITMTLNTDAPINNSFRVVSATNAGDTPTVHDDLDLTDFPVATANVDLYEVRFFCAPGGSSVFWRIERLNTGNVDSGEITTALPTSSTLLSPFIGIGTAAVNSSGMAIDVVSQYIETDF